MVHTLEELLISKLIQTMKGKLLMNKMLSFIIIFISFLMLSGCEDNETNKNIAGVEVVTHDIAALGASGFYFNLSSGTEVDSSSTWHISFQMISVEFGETIYKMPSLILGGTTYVAEYTDILFEDIENTPDSFMSDYFQDASAVQYSGTNEVLQYDMQSHTVSVKDPERVFVVYEIGSHRTYKIQFNDYVGGVIAFMFGSL